MKKFITAVALTVILSVSTVAVAKDDDKVTICHAAGQAGTTKFVTVTVSRNALKGHFDESGTPAAGHEDDYFGACQVAATPTPTPTPVVTPTPSPVILTPSPTPTASTTASPAATPAQPAVTTAPAVQSPTVAPRTAQDIGTWSPGHGGPAPIKKLPSTSTN